MIRRIWEHLARNIFWANLNVFYLQAGVTPYDARIHSTALQACSYQVLTQRRPSLQPAIIQQFVSSRAAHNSSSRQRLNIL